MATSLRKPYQGVYNIVKFNWHFYMFSLLALMVVFGINLYAKTWLSPYLWLLFFGILTTSLISLFVSHYVYDRAGLYELDWLDDLKLGSKAQLVNINAGFDETSSLLKSKFASSELKILDFYDPAKHTEVSIKRARKAYPPFPGTKTMETSKIPISTQTIDAVFLFLSAHEIRQAEERELFFQELQRILKPNGKIILVEHLRDWPNFLAYNIGFFHFHSKTTWLSSFRKSRFRIANTLKITSFVTCFILEKHGITT